MTTNHENQRDLPYAPHHSSATTTMNNSAFKSMMNSAMTAMMKSAVALAALLLSTMVPAHAADLTWGGQYRFEGVKIVNSELTSDNSNKAYMLHHLVLNPKIVAADGLTIFSRLDLLNSLGWGVDPATGAVYWLGGDVIGNGPGTPSTSASNGTTSNAWGRTQRGANLAITSLYASWTEDFGQLIVGRTPVQFGLGTALNAGKGLFDHYIDTRDMVAYKMVFGNLFLMPMIGKVSEGNLGEEDDVNDYSIHMQYDNPETELSLGVLYQLHIGTFAGNDTPIGGEIGGAGAARGDGFKQTLIGLYSSQKAGDFRISVEADLLSGDTGIKNATTGNVGLNAFGLAGEIAWAPTDSKWTGLLKLGMATGDDPDTTDTYEGFQFSRNYDVGVLMFNHPLGQRDLMRTGLIRPTTKASNQIDSEAISNAIYIAPNLQFRTRDNLSWGGALVYGILNKDPIAGDSKTSTNLGFELDLNVTYKPMERLTWITEAAYLLPGDAWKAGTANLDNKAAYGLITKAAISF